MEAGRGWVLAVIWVPRVQSGPTDWVLLLLLPRMLQPPRLSGCLSHSVKAGNNACPLLKGRPKGRQGGKWDHASSQLFQGSEVQCEACSPSNTPPPPAPSPAEGAPVGHSLLH